MADSAWDARSACNLLYPVSVFYPRALSSVYAGPFDAQSS